MKKGDLVRHKTNGSTGTIVSEPYTKIFRDASDWEAASHGIDSCVAATAIRVLWHKAGYERTYKYSDFRRNHEVIGDSTCELPASV